MTIVNYAKPNLKCFTNTFLLVNIFNSDWLLNINVRDVREQYVVNVERIKK